MGAAKKQAIPDHYETIDDKNGATIMLSNSRKRALAKKQNERVLRKKFEKKKPRLSTFRALMIAFILGVLCVGQYGYIQDAGLEINEKQTALGDINAKNEALRQESAALSNRSVVKEKAQKDLGMQDAEEVIVYTPTTPATGENTDAQ